MLLELFVLGCVGVSVFLAVVFWRYVVVPSVVAEEMYPLGKCSVPVCEGKKQGVEVVALPFVYSPLLTEQPYWVYIKKPLEGESVDV